MRVDEQLVSLEEIAAAARRNAADIRGDLDQANIRVIQDWAGRPSVRVLDARRLVDGTLTRGLDRQRELAAHQVLNVEWQRGRARAIVDAVEAVKQEFFKRDGKLHHWEPPRKFDIDRGGYYSRELMEAMVVARRTGGAEYERTVPRPLLNGTVTGRGARLKFISESEAPGAKPAKIKDRVKAKLTRQSRPGDTRVVL